MCPAPGFWADQVSFTAALMNVSGLMGSSFITACINHRFGVRLSESQNGFRAIRTQVLRDLDLKEDITTIEQEMIIQDPEERVSYGRGPYP